MHEDIQRATGYCERCGAGLLLTRCEHGGEIRFADGRWFVFQTGDRETEQMIDYCARNCARGGRRIPPGVEVTLC